MSPTIGPRAVIFDVEGTLVDCVPLILESWRETLHRAGHFVTPGDLQPYSGMDGAWMLEKLLPQETPTARQSLLSAQGKRYRDEYIQLARPFAGVRDLFEALKGYGVAIGIATTCKRDELAVYDERLRVLELTQGVSCGEAVKHGKPDPALLKQSLHVLKVADPAAALAVGDTPYDALAAKSAGMRACGVLTGGFSKPSLQDAGCEYIFDQLQHLRSLWRIE